MATSSSESYRRRVHFQSLSLTSIPKLSLNVSCPQSDAFNDAAGRYSLFPEWASPVRWRMPISNKSWFSWQTLSRTEAGCLIAAATPCGMMTIFQVLGATSANWSFDHQGDAHPYRYAHCWHRCCLVEARFIVRSPPRQPSMFSHQPEVIRFVAFLHP